MNALISNLNIALTLLFIMALCGLVGLFFTVRWVYYDAKSRGMGGGLCILIFLLCPFYIGLLLYLLIRRERSLQIECSHCRSYNVKEARYCSNCGALCNNEQSNFPKKIGPTSLIVGIALTVISYILLFTVGIAYLRSDFGENISDWSFGNHSSGYVVGAITTNTGNKWKMKFRTWDGSKTSTLKAKSENPYLVYSSEITKGEVTFEVLDSNKALISVIEKNTSGEITGLISGEKYYVVGHASEAGGSFVFEMK